MREKSESIDQIFRELETLTEADETTITMMIGLWVPAEYKLRFDQLQELTNKRFGKKVQELVIQAIKHLDGKF